LAQGSYGRYVWNYPDFLDLAEQAGKPRERGLTHVLDKGATITALDALLVQAGHLVDIIKIGWGIAYIDPVVKERVALCHAAGVTVSLGGTLLEVAVAQNRLTEFAALGRRHRSGRPGSLQWPRHADSAAEGSAHP